MRTTKTVYTFHYGKHLYSEALSVPRKLHQVSLLM